MRHELGIEINGTPINNIRYEDYPTNLANNIEDLEEI